MNIFLDKVAFDVAKLGRDHEDRLVSLKEKFNKIYEDFCTIVYVSNQSLHTSAQRLTMLNEKVCRWTGKPLDLKVKMCRTLLLKVRKNRWERAWMRGCV